MNAPATPEGLLRLELEQMQIVLSVIESERESLIRNRVPVTLDDGIPKLSQLDALKRLTDRRYEIMRAAGFAIDLQGTLDWIATSSDSSSAHATWSQLCALVAQVQEINRVNGVIIERRLRTLNESLDSLQRERNGGQTYGPDGKSRSVRSVRPLLEG